MTRFTLAALLLASLAPAQNLVRNGDFEKSPLDWTMSGTTTHTYRVETYDVTGNGKATNVRLIANAGLRNGISQTTVRENGITPHAVMKATTGPTPAPDASNEPSSGMTT